MSGGIALREEDAKRVYLIRAVEAEDRAAQLLTDEDRQQADAYARAEAGRAGSQRAEVFLSARASFATQRLETRHPAIASLLRRTRWPGWLSLIMPLGAFLLGLVSNELGVAKRLELLAFPLLGVIGWNLIVYLSLLAEPLWGHRIGGMGRWLARLAIRPAKFISGGSALGSSVAGRFLADWGRASAGLMARRAAGTLHLAAALFACGVIAGIFLRALTVEYRAGWESTFLGAEQVHWVLSLVLGPAAVLTGIGIPPVDAIAQMRWAGPIGGGVNAGPWIVLWTATLLGVVIVPRLLLAGWNAVLAARRARRVAVPGREDFHTRRLLRVLDGGGGAVRITPYGYTPDDAVSASITALVRQSGGETARVMQDAPVSYGAEEGWIAAAGLASDADLHLVLFSLSSTPEAENHGAFVQQLRERLGQESPGTRLAVLLDEGPFRRHFAGQGGLDRRLEDRNAAWAAILRPQAVPVLSLDLSAAVDDRVAQRAESVLLGGSMMLEGKA